MELQYAAFKPEDIVLLRNVLDAAVESIPPQFRTSDVKGRLAARILKRAATGDRDPVRLRNAALLDFDFRPVPSQEFPAASKVTP